MDQIIGVVGATLVRDTQRLEILGRNIVGAAIPGHKAEIPVLSGFAPLVDILGPASESTGIEVVADMRQGVLHQTGRNLDLGLEGPGAFVVQGGGSAIPTRSGAFEVDAAGRLVDGRGRAVLGPAREELFPGSGAVEIGEDGVIRAEGSAVGQIAVISEFGEDNPGARVSIRQGVLESSNVSAIDQMIGLVETTRHFALAAQALRAYDSMLEAATAQLFEF